MYDEEDIVDEDGGRMTPVLEQSDDDDEVQSNIGSSFTDPKPMSLSGASSHQSLTKDDLSAKPELEISEIENAASSNVSLKANKPAIDVETHSKKAVQSVDSPSCKCAIM